MKGSKHIPLVPTTVQYHQHSFWEQTRASAASQGHHHDFPKQWLRTMPAMPSPARKQKILYVFFQKRAKYRHANSSNAPRRHFPLGCEHSPNVQRVDPSDSLAPLPFPAINPFGRKAMSDGDPPKSESPTQLNPSSDN